MSRAARLLPLVALVVVGACAKKKDHRAEVVECSAISLDVKGTTQCLVQLYHWDPAEATRTATSRHHELDSLKTRAEDSVWNLSAVDHKRQLAGCQRGVDPLTSCLLVSGWPLRRVNATADSLPVIRTLARRQPHPTHPNNGGVHHIPWSNWWVTNSLRFGVMLSSEVDIR